VHHAKRRPEAARSTILMSAVFETPGGGRVIGTTLKGFERNRKRLQVERQVS